MRHISPSSIRPIDFDRLVWSDSLSVGNQVIDQQHRKLIQICHDGVGHFRCKDTNPEAAHQCLNDFVAFLRVHFDTEEDVLLRGHCPSDIYQRHIAEHSKYLEALTEILVEGVWQELDGERLIELMVGWVLHHLTAFDLPSKAFMADCV